MGKKSKKAENCCGAQLNCEAVLAELIGLRDLVEKQAEEQKQTTQQLRAVQKKLRNIKSCNCGKSNKKKKSKNKKTAKPVETIELFGLKAPEGDAADDLKMIAGVGPKLEETLNSLGIYHFHQIAAWQQAEIDWVDDHLMFSGRIERENWIEQAQALAKGGRDEYVKVFGIEPR